MMTYLVNLGAYPVDLVFLTDEDRIAAEKEIERSWGLKRRRRSKDQPIDPVWVSGGNREKVMPGRTGVKHFFLGNVRLLTGEVILDRIGCAPGEVDLVVGGPPCQGFSTAGKQNVMDPRNSLVFEWARLVLEIQPKAICMENVPGILEMVTPEDIPVVDALCRVLADGSFGTVEGLKKSLLAAAGVGGAVRGRRGEGKHRGGMKPTAKGEAPKPNESPVQASMF
jgi:DNA (cytosine-5)-methyltransferase 1